MLAPGGFLILSTPNLARLHSRWHFFWTGTHKLIRRRVGWDLASDDLYAYHIGPVDFPLLHTLLHQAGLAIERLDLTRFKARHAWLLAAYPLVWLATRLETRRHRERLRHPYGEGEDDLFRWMTRPAMLASEQLLLTARKDVTRMAGSSGAAAPSATEQERLLSGGTSAPAETIIFMACSGVMSRYFTFSCGNDEQESGRRIHGARDEEAAERPARLAADLAGRGRGDESEAPRPGRGKLHDRDAAERGRARRAQQQLGDLAQRRVDLVDERDAVHDPVPQREQPLARDVGGDEAHQEQEEVEQDEPEPDHRDPPRPQLPSEDVVEEREELPDDPQREHRGREDEEPGDPVAAQAHAEAGRHRDDPNRVA